MSTTFVRPGEGRHYPMIDGDLLGCCTVVALLYAARWVAYLVVGPDSPPFTTYLGSEVATFLQAIRAA